MVLTCKEQKGKPMLGRHGAEQIQAVLSHFMSERTHCGSTPKAYQAAVTTVSDHDGVAYQTVGDLCRKRLGLKRIDDFYDLLDELIQGKSENMENTLLSNSHPSCHGRIHEYFNRLRGQGSGTPWTEQKQEPISIFLSAEVFKCLRILAAAEGPDPVEWLSKRASELIMKQYDEWLCDQVQTVKEQQSRPLPGPSSNTIDL